MTGYCPSCGAEWSGTPFCTACGRRILPEEPPATGFPSAPPSGPPPLAPAPPPFPTRAPAAPVAYAPLPRRFLALLLDEGIIHLLAWLVAMTAVGAYRAGAGFLPEGEGVSGGWWMGVSLLLGAAWHTAFLGSGGQTPGKRLLGVKVTLASGAPLGYGRALLRTACYPLSAFPFAFGFLWAVWDPRRQGWHDKLAGTVVVPAE